MGKRDPRVDAYIAKFSVAAFTEATRDKRRETAREWMSEGKSRNWKYQR